MTIVQFPTGHDDNRPTASEYRDTAHKILADGLSPIPALPDERRPATILEPFFARRASKVEIESWWSDRSGAPFNIAIVEGPISHDLVLDCDPTGGVPVEDLIAEAETTLGPLPATCVVNTPSGGRHYHYYLPDGSDPGHTRNLFVSPTGKGKIELRVAKSICVIPPSWTVSKATGLPAPYTYAEGCSMANRTDVTQTPLWQVIQASIEQQQDRGDRLPEPTREEIDAARRKYLLILNPEAKRLWNLKPSEVKDRSESCWQFLKEARRSGITNQRDLALLLMSYPPHVKYDEPGRGKEWDAWGHACKSTQKLLEQASQDSQQHQGQLQDAGTAPVAAGQGDDQAAEQAPEDDPITQLLASAQDHAQWVWNAPEPEAIWDGGLHKGETALVTGQPKRGKSTFVNILLAYLSGPELITWTGRQEDGAMATYTLLDGTFLGRKFRGRQRILLITENAPGFWSIRPTLPKVKVLSIYDVRRTGPDALPRLIRSGAFDFIVVDPWDKAFQVRDENSNAEINGVMWPICDAAHETGVAVLFVHHQRKNGGEDGAESRGGSALFGAVDEYWSLERLDGNGINEDEPSGVMRMALKTMGRLAGPRKIVFNCSLDDAWLPGNSDLSTHDKILAVLQAAENPLDVKALAESTGYSRQTVQNQVSELTKNGKIVAERVGRKKVYRFNAMPQA